MSKSYAGIGSRDTPEDVCLEMSHIADDLEDQGYILRSGGADGADLAFEIGVTLEENKEIYIPWKGFNKSQSKLYNINPEAFKIAAHYHPAWSRLKPPAQRLMARNVHQVLGLNLDDPVEFIVCWTKDGKASGGTGQALRIALDRDIPVHNLFNGVFSR